MKSFLLFRFGELAVGWRAEEMVGQVGQTVTKARQVVGWVEEMAAVLAVTMEAWTVAPEGAHFPGAREI